MDVRLQANQPQGYERRRAGPASFLLGNGVDEGEIPSSSPSLLATGISHYLLKVGDLVLGHKDGITGHDSYQLQTLERADPAPQLGRRVKVALVEVAGEPAPKAGE